MKLIALPKRGIAYNECFYRAVEAQGVTVVEGVFSGRWLLEHSRRGDWLHLHWPSFAYAADGGTIRSLKHFLRFATLLLLARLKGIKLVWTAHNLLPHDRSHIPALDVVGRRIVIAMTTLVLAHGPRAARVLTARFPGVRKKLILIPHGHFIGHYPLTQTRKQARKALAIADDAQVYLFIGICKPYKNLEGLIQVFRANPEDAILLVAGKFQDPAYRDRVLELAGDDPRIRISAGFIPDEKIQTYLLACDTVVAPYREVLTSGTAMLAMSFGRPLISVDFGFLRDVVPSEVGVLFSADDKNGLTLALSKVCDLRFNEEQIRAHASRFSFDDAARIFVEALRSVESRAIELPDASRSAP